MGQTEWQNPVGGDWLKKSNWSAGVPDGSVSAVIDGPTLGPTLEGQGMTSNLTVGLDSTSALTIQNGGRLGSSSGFLGVNASSNGSVTVSDTGSRWDLKNLYLGGTSTTSGGTGILTVNAGGTVETDQDVQLWENGAIDLDQGNLSVNRDLTASGGVIEALNGSSLVADSLALTTSAELNFTNASVTVHGDFSAGENTNVSASGGTLETTNFIASNARLTFGDGSTWQNTGTQRFISDSSLFLQTGSDATSGTVILGETGSGLVDLSLAGLSDGATWEISNLTIGGSAAGFVDLRDDTTQIRVLNDATLGVEDSSNGELFLREGDTHAQIDGDLILGVEGEGEVDIRNGGEVVVGGSLRVGVDSTSDNHVKLSGESSLEVDEIILGEGGRGSLTMNSDATSAANVTSTSTFIGLGPEAEGTATLAGEQTLWTNVGVFQVGTEGSGELTVSTGASLETGASSLGALVGSDGTALVTGEASTWLSANLNVGLNGDGELTIADGAQVASSSAEIASNTGSTGTVVVEGTDTGWSIVDQLFLGGDEDSIGGEGSLTIREGAFVLADETTIGEFGLLAGDGELRSDVVNAGRVSPGQSPGTLTIDGDFTQLSSGTLLLEVESGTDFDQLFVNGTLDLNLGTIQIDFTAHSAPTPGEIFTFFPGQNLLGQSLDVETLGLQPGLLLDTESFAATGSFQVIPEPTSAALMLLAAAGWLLFTRRRKGCL